jgi:hypothetical protein
LRSSLCAGAVEVRRLRAERLEVVLDQAYRGPQIADLLFRGGFQAGDRGRGLSVHDSSFEPGMGLVVYQITHYQRIGPQQVRHRLRAAHAGLGELP